MNRLSVKDRKKIVTAYLAFERASARSRTQKAKRSSEVEKYEWAFWELREVVRQDPEEAWSILLDLVRRAEPDALWAIAAGLLEDFVSLYATRFIDRIEAQASSNPKFRSCLGGIYLPDGHSKRVLSRIDRAMRK